MDTIFKHYDWQLSTFGTGNDQANAAQALAWEDALIREVIATSTNNNQQKLEDMKADTAEPSYKEGTVAPSLDASTLPWSETLALNATKDPIKPRGHIHFYTIHHPTVVLGPQDTRLQNLSAGHQYLKTLGYHTQVRAHGGLAIVCDPLITNVSYVIDQKHHPLTIEAAYQQMVLWIKTALRPLGMQVESYEIPNSYCPGKFDLVLEGQKIGGIAQRRFKTGLATSAYLSVGGDQLRRAQLLKDFYAISQADEAYPQIDPNSMTTIADSLKTPMTVDDIQARLIQTIKSVSQASGMETISPFLKAQYPPLYHQTIKRNHFE